MGQPPGSYSPKEVQPIAFPDGRFAARHLYAMTLAELGHFDADIAEIEQAVKLDAFGIAVNQDLGRILYLARRFEEAIFRSRHTLEIAPAAYWTRVHLLLAYSQTGDYQRALKVSEGHEVVTALTRGLMGDSDFVKNYLDQNEPSLAWKGILCLVLRRRRRAIASLEESVRRYESDFLGLCMRGQPFFDELEGDPQLEALLLK